jgi:hypothetical protein
MRPLLLGLALFSAFGFLFVACGHDPGSATASSTASGTGGAPNCEGVYMVDDDIDGGHPCDICLHDHCCAELSECRDQGCIDCVNFLVQSCGPKPRAVNDCLYTYCQPICSPGWPPTATSTGTTGG